MSVFCNSLDSDRANLDGINFKIEILVLNQTIDTLRKNTLKIALAWATTGICCHHTRDRGIGTKERSKFGGGLELG